MNLTKAVIPAAGFGTRMLPAAKAVPKELLPVLDRPAIQYVIEEAAAAGVTEAILVTSPGKPALLNHFRRARRLEEKLRSGGKQALLASVNELTARVRIKAVKQMEQLGLGHAVLQARQAVGDEVFLCMLGDTVFGGSTGPADVSAGPPPARELVEAYHKFGTSIIGLEEVPLEKVERYGIVGGEVIGPGMLRIDSLVEKPKKQDAPSRFAIAARYVLTPAIFDCLDGTTPGALGEIQLTDALRLLVQREPIHGVVLSAKRHDIGNPIDWLRTNLHFAARDAATWKELRPTLDALMRAGEESL